VCPISIRKTARRIIGKAIAVTITEDIQEAAGPLQVCAGQISGCEAVVHAMRQVFESQRTEAVLLGLTIVPVLKSDGKKLNTSGRVHLHTGRGAKRKTQMI